VNTSAITGLTVNSYYDNLGVIRECLFYGFGNGIDGSWDHIKTDHNTFAACGISMWVSGANFPYTDIRYIGAAIINRGNGAGEFDNDHVLGSEAYMVKLSADTNSSEYGNDIIKGTTVESCYHFIIDGDTNGVTAIP